MTVPEGSLTADDLAELDARKRLSDVLGDAASRRRARRRLGLSLADVAELTGLHPESVRYRETDTWKFLHGSLESAAGYRYVQLIARAQGVTL